MLIKPGLILIAITLNSSRIIPTWFACYIFLNRSYLKDEFAKKLQEHKLIAQPGTYNKLKINLFF
jgi:hypothetical protein